MRILYTVLFYITVWPHEFCVNCPKYITSLFIVASGSQLLGTASVGIKLGCLNLLGLKAWLLLGLLAGLLLGLQAWLLLGLQAWPPAAVRNRNQQSHFNPVSFNNDDLSEEIQKGRMNVVFL